MKQQSFCDLMTAAQFFAEASASLSEAVAYTWNPFLDKKDNFCCSKFHLSLAISKFNRAEYYFNCFLKNENLNYCELENIPHTNEELI